MFNVINKNSDKIEKMVCSKKEDVYNYVKQVCPDDFFDDVVNDDAGEDIYLFGKYYKPCDVLKAVNKEKYDELCKQYWEECRKDFYEFLENMDNGETDSLYGFEVAKSV